MSPRQRKTSKRRAAGTPAATQDPPDNCVALQSLSYVDVAIRRIDKVCGLKAIHSESKLNFDHLKNRTLRGTTPWLNKRDPERRFT